MIKKMHSSKPRATITQVGRCFTDDYGVVTIEDWGFDARGLDIPTIDVDGAVCGWPIEELVAISRNKQEKKDQQ